MEHKQKTIFQYKLANLFMRINNGTFVLPTGVSKTRVALIIADHFFKNYGYVKGDVLIVVPTEVLRDTSWPEEIRKWYGQELLDLVEIQCMQSIYLDRTPRKLVIFDEIHNYIPNYTDFIEGDKQFVNYLIDTKIEHKLGLTAFVPLRKRRTIEEICPIKYEMTVEEALNQGFISNFHIYNVPIPISQYSRIEYDKIQAEINKYANFLGGANVAYSNAESILKGMAGLTISALSEGDRVKFGRANKYRKLIGQRKLFLEQNTAKIETCIELVTYYQDKSIIFSSSKDVCNIIAEQASFIGKIHSGVSKKKRAQIIEVFSQDNMLIKCLAAVNAINEGVNVPKVKFSILESGNSSIKDLLQRLGRNLRLAEGEKYAIFAQLYIPDTQDEKWMKNRIYSIPDDKITYLKDYKELIKLL